MNGLSLCRVLAVAVALAATSGQAQRSASGEQRLDSSSPNNLEASVTALRNALPARRREDFDAALAMIWIQRTANDGDLDGDEDFDLDDIRLLQDDAADLLTQIQRGNLVYAVESREKDDGEFKAVDYFAQIDGLGYDEVLSLAGLARAEDYLDAVSNRLSRPLPTPTACSAASSPRLQRRVAEQCADNLATINRVAAQAFNTAIMALGEQRYTDARAALADSTGFRTPYERSKAEEILFSISYAEGDHAAARGHLLLALEAGGLNAQETADTLQRIRFIESGLSATPQ
jgi:hypothetical protein